MNLIHDYLPSSESEPEGVLPATRPRILPLASQSRHITAVLAIFSLSRLMVLAVAVLSWHFAPKYVSDAPLPSSSITDLFKRADANWYLDVIENGYTYREEPATGKAHGNIGFYPAYPFAVKAVRWVVRDTTASAYLVSNAAFFLALLLLWKLALFEFRSETAACWTVAFAAFCPGGAWFSMIFSESCFLLLFVCVLLAGRRKMWLWAAAAGYLLALSRAAGILAVVFVAFEVLEDWWERRKNAGGVANSAISVAGWLQRLLALAAPVLGYTSFFVFLHSQFGDWHALHKVLATNWPANAHISLPWVAIAREWAPMHTSKRVLIYGLLTMGVMLSLLSYPLLRRLSYTMVAFALLTIYTIAAYHSPMARYLSVVVPLHLTFGCLAVRHPWLGWGALACSAALMALFTGLMVNGYVFF